MSVFIFVVPTQQDLWKHNKPSEPRESGGWGSGWGGAESHKHGYFWGESVPVRGFAVRCVCVFEECVETELGLCSVCSPLLGSRAPAAPLEIDGESCVSRCSQTHERTTTQLLRTPKCCVFLFLHSFFFLKEPVKRFTFFFPQMDFEIIGETQRLKSVFGLTCCREILLNVNENKFG